MPRPANPHVRHRLMEAGRTLFLDHGFNGCGVQEISAAAKIPKGSFYSYFASKEDFAVEVLEAYWGGVEARLGSILGDARQAPLKRIARYFKELSDEKAKDNYATGCLLGNFSLEIANASKAVRSRLSEIFERWEEPIIKCLREAQAQRQIGVDCDLRDLAAALIESWEGAAMRAKVEQKRRPYRRFEEVTLPRLLRG
jgi:TetR/AcrR family transcriptional regulator, transcriptional repressor for nem operon